MWDSAKKPIKVRSVLQRNGMRHFIVNQESDEIYLDSLQPRRNSKSAVRPHAADGKDNLRQDQQHKLPERYKSNGDDVPDKNTNTSLVRTRERSDSFPLLRSLTLNESSEESRRQLESDGDLFVIAGSKICNSKKHKRQHNNTRYFHHQLPNSLKENSLLQLQKNMEMYKCQRSKTTDLLDLVPVKSPIIKNLINGRTANSSSGHGDLQQISKTRNDAKDGVPSTTLCSRIMTWIDLEVKRNGGKGGKSFSAVSFTSADLNIVNGLSLPCDLNPSEHNTSPTLSSSSESSASSGESNLSSASISSSSGSSSSCSSSALSFPKLVPCWRKEVVVDGGGSKAKKSVRISDDLPRWGKMKRRLRRKDRSLSLNQLYDDELTPSFMSDHYNVAESKSLNKRNSQTSTFNVAEKKFSTGSKKEEEEDEKETDSFVVCDQRLLASGRVQVHIFLPQTDSTKESKGDVSARSEDSTS